MLYSFINVLMSSPLLCLARNSTTCVSAKAFVRPKRTPLLRLLYAIHLPFGADFCLELGNRPQHIEEQPPGGIAGVDILVQHL